MQLFVAEFMRRAMGQAKTLPTGYRFLVLIALIWASVEMFNGPTAQIIAQRDSHTAELPSPDADREALLAAIASEEAHLAEDPGCPAALGKLAMLRERLQ